METKPSRRRFLECCAQIGGSCCALFLCNKRLFVSEGKGDEKKTDALDLKKLAYCGARCDEGCELFQATQKNDEALKKKIYEQWNWKERFQVEFDPEKVVCWGCKPVNRTLKIGMAACDIRNCAIENGMEACVQCKNLTACETTSWKKWTEFYKQVKKMQERYSSQPGAVLVEIKKKQVVK